MMDPGGSDLFTRKIAWLLWGIPLGLLLIGALFGPRGRTALWAPPFLVMGVGCVVNATHCGRLHCYFTGPLYLLAAAATLLQGLALVSFGWGWIVSAAAVGTLLAFAPEWLHARYVHRT